MTLSTFTHRQHQRGAATLIVTLVLFFAIALVVAFANRAIIFEQRSTTNQLRAAQALEAAEAGLDWATAMLNSPQSIDASCRASKAAGDLSFRERVLAFDAASGHHLPLLETVPVARCVRGGSGWTCSCDATALPNVPPAEAARPAFAVGFERGPQPGSVHLSAIGCTQLAGRCTTNTAVADGTARARVLLALVPGLAAAPAAPLVTRGSVDAGAAAIGLHNLQASAGGLVVDAGGAVIAANARITTAAGASAALAIVERDGALAGADADALFARHFGMDRATWSGQSVVRHVDCAGDCSGALAAAIGDGVQLLWVNGDLRIDGPRTLGSSAKPVIVVATGELRLAGAVVLHGVAYGRSAVWTATTPGSAALHGALLSESGYSGNGAPDLNYDPRVLAALMTTTGSFVRVPGSWRDF